MDNTFLHNMYNATSTSDGDGGIEKYETWLERQLITRLDICITKPFIIEILKESGFLQHGENSFKHVKLGVLFLKNYDSVELINKLMHLGMVHKENDIKKAIGVVEDFKFEPQV